MRFQRLDWFAATGDDQLYVLASSAVRNLCVVGQKPEKVIRSKWYKRVEKFPHGITISSEPTTKNGKFCFVELSGDCFEQWGNQLDGLIVWTLQNGSPNRIDWCVDFVSEIGETEPIFWAENFRGKFRQKIRPQIEIDGEYQRYTGIKSGSTDFVLRYYDKEYESSGENAYEGNRDYWRLEWVCRGNLCKSQEWKRFGSIEEVGRLMWSLLGERFELPYLERNSILPEKRRRYRADFEQRLANLRNSIQRKADKIKTMEVEKTCSDLMGF